MNEKEPERQTGRRGREKEWQGICRWTDGQHERRKNRKSMTERVVAELRRFIVNVW